MGTNYYARVKDLPAHHPHNVIHIGKMVNKADNIDTVIIAYQDRFVRFGYEWFASFLISKGTKIIECQHRVSSPEKELTDDLISIIHVFFISSL